MSFKIKDSLAIGTVTIVNSSGVLQVNAPGLLGGLGGQLPYQSSANTTTFLANGTAGQFLKSQGTTLAPIWSDIPAAVTITSDNSATVFYPLFTTSVSGALTDVRVDNATTPLSYVPSTSTLTASVFSGSLAGNADTATSAGKWTTARTLAGNSVDGSVNVQFSNKFIVQGTADAGLSAAQFLGALGTGIVKNTTTTGVLSIAVAGDFPILNQNTTGSAATLTTSRNIYGNAFNGSADITAVIASTYGGTGNGFTKFTGPTTSEKTFTLPDASATLLYSGGPLGTPSSGTLTNCTSLPISTGVSGLGANVATFLATPSSANLLAALTDETGSGLLVFATSPTFTTSINSSATFSAFAAATALTLGYTGTAASTTNIATGATATATTNTINIGTGGATGSTTNINLGSVAGGTVTINSDFAVAGNFIINGSTTTVNTSTLSVDDKNIELGSVVSSTVSATGTVGSISGTGPWTATITGMVSTAGLVVGSSLTATAGTGTLFGGTPTSVLVSAINSNSSVTYVVTGGTTPTAGTVTNISTTGATNLTADGGGITLKGTTDKTLQWISSTNSWTSSEDINLVTGKVYEINGSTVLSNTSVLGLTPTINAIGYTLSGGTSAVGVTFTATGAATYTFSGTTGQTYTLPSASATLPANNQTMYIGTTAVAINRASADLALTGITSVTGTTTLTLNSTTTNAISIDSTTTGAVNIGTNANAKTVTIGNTTGATSVVLNSGTSGVTANLVAAGIFKVQASAPPTTDMMQITNLGQATVTAGVSAVQVTYVGGAAAVEASAYRTDITPGGTTGGTWNAFRIVPTAGAASGVTLNAIKIDNITGGAGTENALLIGTGWDNILNYNGTVVISGTGLVTAAQLTGTIPSAVLGNSTHYIGTTAVTLNRASANLALTGILSTSFAGATSGTILLQPTAVAGTNTITLPAATGTVALTSDLPTVNNGTLTTSAITAGATNTTVNLNLSATFSANTATNVTVNTVVGPAITALATIMTGATSGYLKKTAADTYTLDTSTFLTAETDTLATVTGRGATTAQVISLTNATDSTTTSTGSLVVTGGIAVNKSLFAAGDIVQATAGGTKIGASNAGQTVLATVSATPVDTWAIATYRSAKYLVQITQGTNYQLSEILVTHNGTTTIMTEFAVLETNGSLATFTSDINTGNARLIVTMLSATSATVNVVKTLVVI